MKEDKFSLQNKAIKDFTDLNDKQAIYFLLNEYRPLLIKYANFAKQKFSNSPLMFEDYYQFLTYCFILRIKTFDFNQQMNFASYIEKFLKMDLSNYSKKFISDKHKALNFSSLIIEDNYIHHNNLNYWDIFQENINTSSLNIKQKTLLESIIKNEGNMKNVSKELNIPLKTVYRHKENLIKKIIILNNIGK